ncbi:MAG: hypothetical protein KBT03_08400 [Bacteroidales bacterium]|nr:hypothetical protein [Candidatus Scybalousia scybalohippi]
MKIWTLVLSLLCIVAFSSCKKNSKEDKDFYNDKNIKEEIIFKRFDKALFAKPEPNLSAYLLTLQKEFPDMFIAPLSNEEYLQQIMEIINDTKMQEVASIVEKEYPDLNSLSKSLTSAFARLKEIYPNTTLPKNVYTMILMASDYSYGYANRVYMNDTNYFAIALDVYALNKLHSHPYYKNYPEYMVATLNKEYIAPDFMRMYLQNATFGTIPMVSMKQGSTLLDCIIEDGKYSYVVKTLLPKSTDYSILRYSSEQMNWVEQNEATIWSFIIQRKLLYDTDRSKYLSLIAEGPETKGLSNSPARVGNYVGYKIVRKFMEENRVSIDSLMKITDATTILNASKYKPTRK